MEKQRSLAEDFCTDKEGQNVSVKLVHEYALESGTYNYTRG